MSTAPRTPHDVLGLQPTASDADVAAAIERRVGELAVRIVSAHAEDRNADLAEMIALEDAWRALAAY